jgi:polyferredoxin
MRIVLGQDLFMWSVMCIVMCPESAAFGGRREVLVFTRQRRRRRGKKRKKRMLPSIKGRRM